MIEILKIALEYKEAGVALLFALLFYFDFRKKVVKMEKTVKKDSDNTEKMEKTVSGLKSVIQNGLIHAIKNLTAEIRKMNDKK